MIAFDSETDAAQALEWKPSGETLTVSLPRLLIGEMIVVEFSPAK